MIQNRVTEILFRNFFLFLLKFILTNDRYYYLLCHRHYFKSFTHINSCNLLKFQELAIVIPPLPPLQMRQLREMKLCILSEAECRAT